MKIWNVLFALTICSHAACATELLIGSSLPLEGSFSAVGIVSKQAMEAAFAESNANNIIPGTTLKLIAYNDGYEPVPCVKNTLKLLNEDKVFALCTYVGTLVPM